MALDLQGQLLLKKEIKSDHPDHIYSGRHLYQQSFQSNQKTGHSKVILMK